MEFIFLYKTQIGKKIGSKSRPGEIGFSNKPGGVIPCIKRIVFYNYGGGLSA
jgi:hypothetical protein